MDKKERLDDLVIQALMPVFPPSEMDGIPEVAALAHCVVMETPGWENITQQEIRGSLGRIWQKHVVRAGRLGQPVHWDVTDVLRYLCPYKKKYPELLAGIYWWGVCPD